MLAKGSSGMDVEDVELVTSEAAALELNSSYSFLILTPNAESMVIVV